jgi:hypothetical protein
VLACGSEIPVPEVGGGRQGLSDDLPSDSIRFSETRLWFAADRR